MKYNEKFIELITEARNGMDSLQLAIDIIENIICFDITTNEIEKGLKLHEAKRILIEIKEVENECDN